MDKDLEFNFNMLSRRQLQKLCNYYSLKISGALPNKYTTDEELLQLVEENLQVLDDGTIARKEDKEDIIEVKLLGGSRIRMIII
jgi:hypothetical protein